MIQGLDRFCDGCGQKLPAGSKLSQQLVPQAEAAAMRATGVENPDGSVTIDLCLNCRIHRAEQMKR